MISIAMGAFSLHFGVYPLTFVLVPEIIPEKVSQNEKAILFQKYQIITDSFRFQFQFQFTDSSPWCHMDV